MNNVIEELENDISNFVSGETSADEDQPEEGGGRAEENIIERMDGDMEPPKEEGGLRQRGARDVPVKADDGNEPEMTIKLKYLNDDMKMVTGKSSEAIGDFKK